MKRKFRNAAAGAAALAAVGSALFTGTAHAASAETTLTAKIFSPNGFCMTIADADYGQLITQAPCLHAHNFVYDITHANIYVQGHPGYCLAGLDGSYLFIDQCSQEDTIVNTDVTRTIDNIPYTEIRWTYLNVYAHANGNGEKITMISTPGSSEAVDWYFQNLGT